MAIGSFVHLWLAIFFSTQVFANDLPHLKKMADQLRAKHYESVIAMEPSVPEKSDYAVYESFLRAQAHLSRGRNLFFQNKLDSAARDFNAAMSQFKLSIGTADSNGFTKRASRYLAESGLALGEIYFKKGKGSLAASTMEESFSRLSSLSSLSLVSQEQIVAYSELCEKTSTIQCRNWMDKLSRIFDKNGIETSIVRRVQSFKIEKPPSVATTGTTYNVATDLQAYQKAWEQYLQGDYVNSYVGFRDLLKNFPKTNIKIKSKFWMSRSAEQAGHSLQSKTICLEIVREAPFSYFAMVCGWKFGIDMARMISGEMPPSEIAPTQMNPVDVQHLKRAETLVRAGLSELAALELKDIKAAEAYPNEFLGYLALLNDKTKSHRVAFQIFTELASRNSTILFSSFGESLLFPRTHLDLIKKYSVRAQVNPLVVISIIKQESAFDSEAVSSANAFGLMQLIRPTARDLEKNIAIMDLLSPEKNIELGSRYISELISRYQGNLVYALAAYNAGPQNADRWKKETPENLPWEEIIERIGYRETRDYVQGILRNIYWYNRLLNREKYSGIEEIINAMKVTH